jgi:hypothetical protein
MSTAHLGGRISQLLSRLSRSPRFSGSEAEADALRFCRIQLQNSGLTCRENRFEYSQWPGKWGPPVAAGAQLVTILIVARMARNGDPMTGFAFGATLLSALAIVSRNARRTWTSVFPLLRASGVNLEGSRGTPSVWLVAHIDTKSQTVPMLYRIASVVSLNLFTAAAFGLALLQATGFTTVRSYWLILSLLAGLAALPSLMCLVRNDSPGAVDNGSGVAAVLLAAEQLAPDQSVGVLITSGEELGLAGAREWATRLAVGARVVNCDTVDDSGTWLCMYTGPRPELASLAETVARRSGVNLRARRLIPGILADSVAFSDHGFESVTVSRGSLATLARIHTRRDNSAALTGSSIGTAAALMAALTTELG